MVSTAQEYLQLSHANRGYGRDKMLKDCGKKCFLVFSDINRGLVSEQLLTRMLHEWLNARPAYRFR